MAEKPGVDVETPVARRILIAVDGSVESAYAAEYALKLAHALGSEMIFASVVGVDVPTEAAYLDSDAGTSDPVEDAIEGEALEKAPEALQRDLLDSWQQAAKSHGLAAEAVLDYGSAAPTLLQIASVQRADLLICGTHGRRGLRRAMLGSVAESLLRQAPCPVLVVRRPAV
jgi:nucleotide-binding universal stress UspA family protein